MSRSTRPDWKHGSIAPLDSRARRRRLGGSGRHSRGLARRLRIAPEITRLRTDIAAGRAGRRFLRLQPAGAGPVRHAFKDVPGPLTEVLVFHQPGARRTSEDADCFRPSAAVSFLGRTPTDHLVCFDHDRLQRIEASIVLPAPDAPALFAAACADWRGGNSAAAPEPDACEGRRGDIAFSAHRAEGPDGADVTLSITLTAIAVKAPP